jgi:nucleoside-diphosphate-sugar epimerase
MRVLVAGATGVLGRELMPALAAAGHEAQGFSRRGGEGLRAIDALDIDAVAGLAASFRPDAVVNLLTAIPEDVNPRKVAAAFAPTNRLRAEGTRNLIASAPEAFHVAESIAFIYDPAPGLATEDDPVWADPPAPFVPILAAVDTMERATLDAGGAVLRLGYLHGPGTGFAPEGSMTKLVRKRQMPLGGASASMLPFLHTADAAAAFVAVLERRERGILNVVEDDPAPMHEWLPAYAKRIGAKPPRKLPVWLVRMAAGPYGVAFLNDIRGSSNARAKQALGWAPRHHFP